MNWDVDKWTVRCEIPAVEYVRNDKDFIGTLILHYTRSDDGVNYGYIHHIKEAGSKQAYDFKWHMEGETHWKEFGDFPWDKFGKEPLEFLVEVKPRDKKNPHISFAKFKMNPIKYFEKAAA